MAGISAILCVDGWPWSIFAPLAASIEYVRDGRLRALAVTAATRLEALPGIPTVGNFVTGYEATSLYGVGAPPNTPAEIVDKLNNEVDAALADPKTNARISDFGGVPTAMTPAVLRSSGRRGKTCVRVGWRSPEAEC
jgi:tripartite-type tricarboxylate transporter receptor subunit TctC